MKGTHRSLSLLVLLLCLSCQAAIRKGPGETIVLQSENLSGTDRW